MTLAVWAMAGPSVAARPPRARTLAPLERVDRYRALKPWQRPAGLMAVPDDLGLEGRRLARLPLAYFADMSDAVKRRLGRRLLISSGYRSYAEQRELFGRYIQEGVQRGLSRKRARREANVFSAAPGHSEHQLGTTIDIVDRRTRMLLQGPRQDPKLQRWLRNNAHRYGFVNSYPNERRDPRGDPLKSRTYKKTGYIPEPWHWRFLGKRAAAFHRKQEQRRRRRITTHEFIRELDRKKNRALKRRLSRPHAHDRLALKRLRMRLRRSRRTRGVGRS